MKQSKKLRSSATTTKVSETKQTTQHSKSNSFYNLTLYKGGSANLTGVVQPDADVSEDEEYQ